MCQKANNAHGDVSAFILDRVAAPEGITALEMSSALQGVYGGSVREYKAVLRGMIERGELAYRELHGRTCLGHGLDVPLRLSSRIVLIPASSNPCLGEGDRGIRILPGIAFGEGNHPTSRLCVQLLDEITARIPQDILSSASMLDVGTGSGILMISGLMFGIGAASGSDIDPMARAEAVQNLALNNLSFRAIVHGTNLEKISSTYNIIAANLRFPTLIEMLPEMNRLLVPGGDIVFSGFRPDEAGSLLRGMDMYWDVDDLVESHGWAAVKAKKKLVRR